MRESDVVMAIIVWNSGRLRLPATDYPRGIFIIFSFAFFVLFFAHSAFEEELARNDDTRFNQILACPSLVPLAAFVLEKVNK